MSWPLLQNSLLVAAGTASFAVLLGFCAALWFCGLEKRSRGWVLILGVTALALPPFLVTSVWLRLLGHAGAWRDLFPFSIYSMGGTIWILVLLTWPIALFLVAGAWQKLEPELLECDPVLRGWSLIRWLLIPQARPALGMAGLLIFTLALNQFAVPALLQTKVLPAEIWIAFNTNFDYQSAFLTCAPLVAASCILLVLVTRGSAVSWPRLSGGVPATIFRQRIGPIWFYCSGLLIACIFLAGIALPLVDLLLDRATWRDLGPAIEASSGALRNAFTYAVTAATLSLVVGLAVWRWRLGALLWLTFFPPGVLLGIGLIFALNRPVLTAFYQSAGMAVLALTLRYAAIGWNCVRLGMSTIDPSLSDYARLHGASSWQFWRHVYWPQISKSLLAGWSIIYLFCLWDVETLLLVYPPGGETAAVKIFNLLHYGHTGHVNALCLALLGLAVLPLLAWALVSQIRRSYAWAKGGSGQSGGPPQNSVGTTSLTTRWLVLLVVTTSALLWGGCAPVSEGQGLESRLFSSVQIIGERGTGLGQFNKPRSVALDRHDNLYVADMTGRIQKFSPDGKFMLSWQMPQTDKGKPKGMCLDNAGNIIVIEPHYSRLNHFTLGGQLVVQWGHHGPEPGQLLFPRAVAVNSRGETYVSEYGVQERIQQFAPFGKECLKTFGREGGGAGEFSRPEGLGVDRLDRLYVADSCNHRIQVFSARGEFLRAYGHAGSGTGELSYPYDVRVDSQGRQYVCEFGNSRVQIFDQHDRPFEIIGGPGAAAGKFSNPWSIALDSRGNLYVADSMNHRVQKFLRRPAELSEARGP
jgi:ABC-type Fe3+ transport system permease subunit/DNA-binding beta-propeller fold protein YncE